MRVTLYHNPRCSKSRQTLQLLEDNGVTPTVIEYLKTPPSIEELNSLLTLLNLQPRELMRTKEAEYTEKQLDNVNLTRDELIAAMVATPKLIERPIAVTDDKAVIGRPPENVLTLL